MTIRPVILCVDDDPTVLRSLKDQLRGRLGSGFLIETAESSTEALEVLDELHAEGHPIPLVIADQLMPGTSGADFLAEVHRRLPDTRNVLLTGQASTAAIGTAVNEAQLYRYIPKPWEPADLLLTVEQAITSFDHDRELERHRRELSHLNEELQRQVQQQRVLIMAVEQADDAVVTTSLDWKIEFANPAFSALTGYEVDELGGQDISILDWCTGEPGGLDEMRQTLAGGQRWRGSLTLRRKDDRNLIAKASVSPILSTGGTPSGFVCVMHDVTREEELRRRSEVERKLEALGTLAGGVAHDFNNLLVPILGYATMGTDEVQGGSELHGYFTEIMEAAERAKELVQEILAFSRKREPGHESPVDLRPITNKILARLRTVAPSEIRIEHTMPDNPVAARISEIHLHQLLTNLTNNAVHAMAEDGGTLTVQLTSGELDEGVAEYASLEPGPYARLTIRDTGTGILPEHVDKIFDPFFTTKAVGEGTGMGLSIAHGVVTSLGGTITVETGNGGTTFEVYLPLELEGEVGI